MGNKENNCIKVGYCKFTKLGNNPVNDMVSEITGKTAIEIVNTLIHMTDGTQNDSFFDKYFYDIPLDLSKALIIFTYNNDHMINPILKDRMIRITTDDYNIKDKINIAQDFLIPELCKDFNFDRSDLIFTDKIIRYIISKTDDETKRDKFS